MSKINIAMRTNSRKVVNDAQRITSKTEYNYIGISIPDGSRIKSGVR